MKFINLKSIFRHRNEKRTLGSMMISGWVLMISLSIFLFIASIIFHFSVFYDLSSERFLRRLGTENAEYKSVDRDQLLRFVNYANEKQEKIEWGEIKKSTSTGTSSPDSIDQE